MVHIGSTYITNLRMTYVEEELSEKVSFHNKQMTELGYENYSDRKYRRINL